MVRSKAVGPRQATGVARDLQLKKREAQNRALELYSQGLTVEQAMAAVGRKPHTWEMWREREPWFAAKTLAIAGRDRAAPAPFPQFRRSMFGFDTFWHQQRMVDAIEGAKGMEITMVLLPPEWGKALADDTAIPTPAGWTTMGDLNVGDLVLGADGRPTTVTGVFPQPLRPMWRLTFADGASIDCDADHLWLTRTRKPAKQQSVKTTREIAATLMAHGRPNHGVPVNGALQLPEADLPIDPYVFGYWLGDGTSRAAQITTGAEDRDHLVAQIEAAGYRATLRRDRTAWRVQVTTGAPVRQGFESQLRRLGVWGDKHIPGCYLRGSYEQRLALLQGLMDSDGHANASVLSCEFTTVSERLATDVEELMHTLGLKVRLNKAVAKFNGIEVGPKYRLHVTPRIPIFRLPRKLARLKFDIRGDRNRWNTIVGAEEIAPRPARCIMVDNGDSLYLAGPDFVVTHNSTVIEDYICYVLGAIDPNHRFAIISEGLYQARKMVRRIQQRMTDEDSAYVQRYGPFRATDRSEQKPWNADFFSVIRSSGDERDYSLEARGAGAKIYGSRWDTVILDDIQSTQNINQTDKLLEFFRQDVLTRPGLAGRIIVIGTRVGPGDFYERLLEEEMADEVVLIPAVDDEGRSMFPAVFDKAGKRVMNGKQPLGWSEDELAARRQKVGEETWARVYMQQPQSKAGAPFTEEAIRRCLDPRRRIGDSNPGMAVMCSIDPALTGHASLKACGYDAERMYLLDTENVVAPGRYEELYALVEKMAAKWQPGEFIFEVNAMQKGLARDDRLREMAERLGFRIVEHTTRQNKMDTAIGVAAMADGFRRGEVVLPDGDDATRRQLTQLVTELRRWRPDIPTRLLRQDEVMSLWFCYLRWRQLRDHLTSSGSGLRIGGMGWTPTPYGRVA